ncbi:phosphotransferase [Anaerocolumna sp. AGMB13025]|uniref:aminoglycoside phosphotransferase family protein n=1 Tax=Anaerocolumna sp. AGMB13025 TaxID=3039116 RepID=UPI00241DB10A|nr:phosphotransferase [Anaerocolumna sp. AGMB13025]WFR55622.1 phosphotransferase [Anaerocolumna sp. AGMB13025]
MIDIPIYDTFSKIEPITKGMSGDKKYYIETTEGKHLLLRIADSSEYLKKKTEYEVMKEMSACNVPMPSPIDFGICDNGKSVYTLLSWIEGVEVESILGTLSAKEQYQMGLESGKILKKIHGVQAKDGISDWSERYFSVINPRIAAFHSDGVRFPGDTIILDYLERNRELLNNRPQCRHHGDYHMGNMIQTVSGNLSIIDWHTVDFDNYGDPWYEFNRIGVECAEFASGQINGYFDNEVPDKFWMLLLYYLSASAITSIVWAKYFAPDEMPSILKMNTDIICSFDDMKNPVPTWYINNKFYQTE